MTEHGGRQPINDELKQQIVDLAKTGLARNEIARQMGVAPSSVSKFCKAAGVGFDRTATAKATSAKQVDNKARRAELTERLLREAKGFLDDLHAPHVAYSFGGRDNTYAEHRFDKPPQDTRLKLMQSFNIAIGRHIDLDKVDSTEGVDNAKSLLTDLGRALGIKPADDA
jgi:transposase-like protein